MKGFLSIMFLITTSLTITAAQQDNRPPLSKDEVRDLLISSTPSNVIISTINEHGIAFQPTPQVLEEFRKAGADKTVLAALRQAWHADIPRPLGDREILILLAGDAPSENIVRLVRGRGIDFTPTVDYLEQLRSQGAKDILLDTLRKMAPTPFSKDELLRQLTAGVDQERLAQKVQQRAVDFEASTENLKAFRNAGAGTPLLGAIRTAERVKPFVGQTVGAPPPQVSRPLFGGRSATLICEPSDSDVPVFENSGDLGKIIARLKCGEQITFLERVASPPGFDRIQFGAGIEGMVSNSYLEFAMASPGGDVTAPAPIFKPDPQYTPAARRDRIEGTVTLSIVIDTQGKVSDVQQVSVPLGAGLDNNAIDTVKKWRFTPSMRRGLPVPVRVRVEMSFHLSQQTP